MDNLPPFLQAMLVADFYPHPVGEIHLLQTHASFVVLTGTYAYKFKKPVDFGFLNYATLERRHHFCTEELRLNRRLAPALYLEVQAVVQGKQGFELAAENTEGAIEYCVRMREFGQEQLLSHLFAEGEVTLALMERLGRRIAEFHREAPTTPAFGSPELVRAPVDANYDTTGVYVGTLQQEHQYTQTRAFTDQFFSTHAALFEQRREQGRIRECHGDLHLGNIALIDGEVTIFDCIEFNESFRCTDVMAEIAFLLMDLEARARPDLANCALNTYLEATGDWEGVTLLPLYLSYRAYVRAKVGALTADDPGVTPEARETAMALARGYFHQAWQYTQAGQTRLFILHGVSGSGKSTVAREVSLHTRAIHLRSDAVRKHLAGVPLGSNQSAPPGSGIYSDGMTRQTYDRMLKLAGVALAAGFSVVLDARYPRRAQRQAALALADALGVPATILECVAPREVLEKRLRERSQDISDADADLLDHQMAETEPLTDEERERARRIDSQTGLETLVQLW